MWFSPLHTVIRADSIIYLDWALFVLVILLDFTGYILRWDVDICYPLLTGTNLLKTIPVVGNFLYRIAVGGGEACSTGLLRFYIWHIFGLTIAAVILMVWHAFRVRRDGGIAVPPPQLRSDNKRISRNELVRREVLAIFLVGIALIILSMFIPGADRCCDDRKTHCTGEARAPGFSYGFSKCLNGVIHLFSVCLIPLGVLAVFALIPYIFPKPADSDIGRWFPKSNRLAQIVVGLIALIVIALTLLRSFRRNLR